MTGRLTLLLQRLAVVAAAVALLSHGGVQLAPRLMTAGAGGTAAVGPSVERSASSRPAAESQPVERLPTLRAPLVAAVPGGADVAAGPGSSPLVAPHLVSAPVVRPPTRAHVLEVGGGGSGRAPPAPAGT